TTAFSSFMLIDPAPPLTSPLPLHDALPIFLIAGTYNAHPINTAAAIATLKALHNGNVYKHLDLVSKKLYTSLEKMFTDKGMPMRSEEHTSELQSRENLVCRLLLEKKK